MSGIALIFHRDASPSDPDSLMRMMSASPDRARDGAGQFTSGPVDLGHQMLHTTLESIAESQPFVDRPSGLCISMDGRVDNRAELVRDVNQHPEAGDAELVLRCYQRWGPACAHRIVGDFAFAIWDPRERRVFLVRDAMGIKPLYYYADSRIFLAASELTQIVAHPGVSPCVNEALAAEYLACAMTGAEETLYRGIYRLPPAHSLTVTAAGLIKRRYFDIDAAKTIRYQRDEDYSDHFLEIFSEAVRCRLRSQTAAGVFLSGGVDSSSVAGVACRLRKPLDAFSMVFPGEACDESAFIGDMVVKSGVRSHTAGASGKNAAEYLAQVRRFNDFPDYPNGAMSNSLSQVALQKECRVILTGLGGDEWLMGSHYGYADLLKRLKVRSLARKLRANARAGGGRFSWRTLLRFGLWPLLPKSAQTIAGGFLDRNRIPSWIDARFAARTGLAERLRQDTPTPPFPTLAQKDLYSVYASGWRVHALEMEERSASSFGMEQRHPFSDRRLLEFALALPEDQRWRDDRTKFVLRQAMRPILPESIRERRSKAEFSSVFLKAFQRNGGAHSFENLPIAAAGWVDQREVERKYRRMENEHRSGSLGYTRHTCPLWMVFGINLWFDAVVSRNAVGGP